MFELGFSRRKAVAVIAAVGSVIGICIEGIVSGWMDIFSVYLCPLGAFLAGVLFFWVCGDKFVREQVDMGAKRKLGRWFTFGSKYLFCGLTILVLQMSADWALQWAVWL